MEVRSPAHEEQNAEPFCAAYLPISHNVHDALLASEEVATGQSVQFLDPLREKVPAAQELQRMLDDTDE